MDKSRIHHGDWVVVCDGRKALILENRGDQKYLNLHKVEVREYRDLPTRDLGSDRPGRVYESVGSARSAVQERDLHAIAEANFITEIVHYLEVAVAKDPDRRLIVVAPPRALGTFRHACPQIVSSAIVLEIDKDWVKMPISDIEKRLFALE